MASDVERRAQRSRGPSLPALMVMGALAVVGAITLLQWAVAVFTWLLTFAMLLVVLLGLGLWVVTLKRRG